MHILSGRLNYLYIFPIVSCNAPSCVYANLRTDLDTDHLTGWPNCTTKERETSTRSTTYIENTISLFEIEQLDCLFPQRFYERGIKIGKWSNEANSVPKIGWGEFCLALVHEINALCNPQEYSARTVVAPNSANN